MLYCQIILAFIYFLIAYHKFKKYPFLRDVLSFFIALYGLQLIGAVADPYHIHTIRFSTILYFNLQIVFILVGSLVAINKGYRTNNHDTTKIFNFSINKPILIIQSIFLLVVYYRYKKMSAFLMTAALTNEARGYFFDNFYSSYTELFLNQFVDSFLFISYFFAFGLLFFKKQKMSIKDIYMIITTVVIVVLNTLTSFGRTSIIQIFVVFILFFILSKDYDKTIFHKKAIPVSIALAGIVVAVFAITTVVRSNLGDIAALEEQTDDLIIKPFATYFYVPICAFDYGSIRIFSDLVPMFGAADLAAPIDFILTPLRIIDHGIYSPNMVLGAKMTPGFSFPSGEGWNALFTGASNYYIDFGFMGFIIFPFIHGYLFSYLCYRCRNRGSWFVVFLFLFISSFTHLMSSGIQSMSVIFFIIWIYIIKRIKAIN